MFNHQPFSTRSINQITPEWIYDTKAPILVKTIPSKNEEVTVPYLLSLYLTEPTECRYSFDRLFKWDNSTIIGSGTENHNIEWSYNTYYIQCEDAYGNKGGITKIRPFYKG